MKDRIAIARSLLRLARMLVAGNENFGFYEVEFDEGKRTFTVYFIPKEDAVESDALKNAKACRYEIKSLLEKDGLIEVTNIENNQRSFCFTILVDEKEEDDEEKKASFGSFKMMVAAPDDEEDSGDDSGDDEEDSGDDSGDDSDGDDGDGDAEEKKADPEEQKRFKSIQDTVKRVCRKYGWDTKK